MARGGERESEREKQVISQDRREKDLGKGGVQVVGEKVVWGVLEDV